MTSGRMRRVDEAMRQVLSDAVPQDLKDPRVGFVTVTDVKTSPDLRHARVYVSVLGDEPAREASLAGAAVRARLPAAPRGLRAAPQAHADAALPLRRHRGARAAARAAHRRRRPGRRSARRERDRRTPRRSRRCSTSCAATRSSSSSPTSTPTATRSARWSPCTGCSRRSARTRSCSCAADELPLPYEYRFFQLEGMVTDRARRRRRARGRVPGLRQHRPHAGRHPQARRRADPQPRPPPRQHALRDGQPRRAATPRAPPRSCGTSCATSAWSRRATIADALYVGLVTDTGKFMYENTGPRAHLMAAELIEAGVDVHGDLPPPVRGHALSEARAARPRPGQRASATTTAA